MINIAIDGPAGAGKSTVAKVVADRLHYLYIDTGAMYRALTLKAIQNEYDLENGKKLLELLQKTNIELRIIEKGQAVLLDGNVVTEEIRTSEVTNNVSLVAKHEEVRNEMVKRQQEMAIDGGVVMDGRDIGTHVLPNASVKIFLVASVEERAQRRHKENLEKGFPSDLEIIKREIAKRDQIDSERKAAPLRKAEDAIEVDTTNMGISEVVEEILKIVKQKG